MKKYLLRFIMLSLLVLDACGIEASSDQISILAIRRKSEKMLYISIHTYLSDPREMDKFVFYVISNKKRYQLVSRDVFVTGSQTGDRNIIIEFPVSNWMIMNTEITELSEAKTASIEIGIEGKNELSRTMVVSIVDQVKK